MMNRLFFGILLIVSVSCTSKKSDQIEVAPVFEDIVDTPTIKKMAENQPEIFSKTLRESIHFSSSLEREALNLINKNNSTQHSSLFNVLSYIVEINSGSKRATPMGLDCGRFEIKRQMGTMKIFKVCTKPAIEVAQIKVISENFLYDIEFFTREWGSVVGMTTSLTSDNTRCHLRIKEKKLNRLDCENWAYQVRESSDSSTVLKTKKFVFDREVKDQFVIQGGFFKDLVENKKINIIVPIEGKIKVIEKEIKVIDEFAEIIKKESEKNNEEKKEIKNEGVFEEGQKDQSNQSEESSKENNKKNNQEGEQSNQEVDSQGGQEDQRQEVPEEEREKPSTEGRTRGGRGR